MPKRVYPLKESWKNEIGYSALFLIKMNYYYSQNKKRMLLLLKPHKKKDTKC